MSRVSKWARNVSDVVFTGFVIINAAIAITALVVAVWSLGDFVSPLLWRCGAFAIFGWLILSTERENRRLRSTPTWRAASDAYAKGWRDGSQATSRWMKP